MHKPLVLITGISGFIAKHCALEMLRHGYRVRGTVRSLARGDTVRATLAQHTDVAQLELVQADLEADAGWQQAMAGVHAVLHLASPFPINEPRHPDELIKPAVEGTLRVLRAALAAGVQQFVQTSSIAAMAYGHNPARAQPFTEADWTVLDVPGVSSYVRSKTLAERAARDFLAAERPALYYASICPGLVLGPLLDRDAGSSAEVIAMFLRGKYPAYPKLCFGVVDVRDVATMHRLALELPLPSGGRYMAVSEAAWFADMLRPIQAQLGARSRKVPRHALPNALVRLLALVDPGSRAIVAELGRELHLDNRQTRLALQMDFIPVTQSAPAMAQSLLDLGLV